MKNKRILIAFLLSFSMLVSGFLPSNADSDITQNSISYQFSDSKCALATGTITINSYNVTGICELYWGDQNGIFSEYMPLATLNVTAGQATNYSPYKKTVIPVGATFLYGVVDSAITFTYEIPTSKQFSTATYGPKQCSFGQLSDTHVIKDPGDLPRALTYFNDHSADFVAISGDLIESKVESEYQQYASIIAPYSDTMPVYASSGNHDSSSTLNLSLWKKYTSPGELFYEVDKGNDVFLFMGLYIWDFKRAFTDAEMKWLEQRLAANKDKRVFLENHLYLQNTCGNLYDPITKVSIYSPSNLWPTDSLQENAFRRLMQKYKNVIAFSGHSHWKFSMQKYNPDLNIFDGDGTYANLVHVSSCSEPADNISSTRVFDMPGSEGYFVDVYDNCVILHAVDFVTSKFITEANYIIDTRPQGQTEYIPTLSGSGTKADPYLINSENDFLTFTSDVINNQEFEGKYFAQTKDLDLSGISNYKGITDKFTFCGIYDGRGHRIKVNISDTSASNISVFPNIEGVVMNISTEGNISNPTANTKISGIATRVISKGALINTYSNMTLSGSNCAGIAYINVGTIANTYFTGTISGSSTKYAISSTESGNNSPYNCFYLSKSGTNNLVGAKPKTALELSSQSFVDQLNSKLWYSSSIAQKIQAADLLQWTLKTGSYAAFSSLNAINAPGTLPTSPDVFDDFTTFSTAPKYYAIDRLKLKTAIFNTQFGPLPNALEPYDGAKNVSVTYSGDFGGKQLTYLALLEDNFVNSSIANTYLGIDRWGAFEEGICTAQYEVYAGSILSNMTKINPYGYTFIRPGASMRLSAEVITNLPENTNFVKIVIVNSSWMTKIGYVEIANPNLTAPIIEPRPDYDLQPITSAITKINLLNQYGGTTTSKYPGGKIDSITISSSNNGSGNIVAAVYDGDMLVAVKVVPYSVVISPSTVSISLDIPTVIKNNINIKLMFWSNVDGLIPISKVFTY